MYMDFLFGIFLGLMVLSVALLALSVFKVEEGHGTVLSEFGRVLTKGQSINHEVLMFGPGVYFKKPWQKVHGFSTMEKILELVGSERGTVALAADGTQLRIDSKLRYTIHGENRNIYTYLFSLRRPMEHIKGLFTCLLRNEIANFQGNRLAYEIQPTAYAAIRRERRQLNERIKIFCQSQIDGKYGVNLSSVDLTDICPPNELAESLNAVFNAQLEAEAHYSRAEGECRQKVISSEQGVEIARANGEASMIDIIESGRHLEQLHLDQTLSDYVERRKNEVVGESRTVFVRS